MLQLKQITFSAPQENGGERQILSHVDFTAEQGKFIVITGPNGSGKSTLARIIVGIQQPDEGQIFFQGEDITNLSISERAKRGIAFAFQQPVRFKGLTVSDLLGLAAGKELLTRKQMCTYLQQVGLCAADYIDRDVNASLSGGEIKRIEIAMAMARKAPLTIFDEPEAGIDLWSFNHLIDVFRRLRDVTKGTVIIISHQERILDIADEIVVLSGGQISARGKKEEILPTLLESRGMTNRGPGCLVDRTACPREGSEGA